MADDGMQHDFDPGGELRKINEDLLAMKRELSSPVPPPVVAAPLPPPGQPPRLPDDPSWFANIESHLGQLRENFKRESERLRPLTAKWIANKEALLELSRANRDGTAGPDVHQRLDALLREEMVLVQQHNDVSFDELMASMPAETAARVRARIAAMIPNQASSPPPSGDRLPSPGSPLPPERPELSETALKETVGEKRWPAFKRLLDEFNYSLRGAHDAVELLGDAITHEDFSRWMPKARKEVDIATARFAMIAEDLDHSGHEYAVAVRDQLREMETELTRLTTKGPPQTNTMKITGEYER